MAIAADSLSGKQITEKNLLLVEGHEEEVFFAAMAKHLRINDLQIRGLEGKSKLPHKIRAQTLTPGFESVVSLGVIRDADRSPKSAFQSVRGALRAAGLGVPPRAGEPSRNGTPTVRVFIVPSNDSPGMLEDLCLRAVSSDDAMDCVEKYFECLTGKNITKCDNISKAKVQAFLSSRRKPGLLLGQAASKGYIPWDSKAFLSLTKFLRDVVTQQPS